MREVLIYWVIGCVIFGFVYGNGDKNYPNDKKLPPSDVGVLVLVATWPTHVIRGFFNKEEAKP